MIGRIHAFGRRFVVMLSGEIMQSAFNFVLNIFLVRAMPAELYGTFAIAMVIGGFGIMYMRALIGVPACIYIPQNKRFANASFYAVMFGSAALAVSGLWTALVAVIFLFWHPASAIAAGTFAGAWALRYYMRMALFAQGKAALATASDFSFTITGALFCAPALIFVHGPALLGAILFALTAAHLFGAGLSFVVLRQSVRFSLNRAIRIRLLRLLPAMTWSLISVTAANIQGQGAVLLLAAIAGPAAYAPIAATMMFFSPLRLAGAALANMTQPDYASTMARKGPRAVLETLILSTAMIAALCLAYGLALYYTFPFLAEHAFAGRFDGEPLALIAALLWAIASIAVLYSVPRTLLETVQKYRENTALAVIAAVVGLPFVLVLLTTATPAWSLFGLLISECVVLLGSWLAVMPVINHASRKPGPVRPRHPVIRFFANPGVVPARTDRV